MHTIPERGFVPLDQILEIFLIDETCWRDGIDSSRFPKAARISSRGALWRAEEIRDLIFELAGQSQSVTAAWENYRFADIRLAIALRTAILRAGKLTKL